MFQKSGTCTQIINLTISAVDEKGDQKNNGPSFPAFCLGFWNLVDCHDKRRTTYHSSQVRWYRATRPDSSCWAAQLGDAQLVKLWHFTHATIWMKCHPLMNGNPGHCCELGEPSKSDRLLLATAPLIAKLFSSRSLPTESYCSLSTAFARHICTSQIDLLPYYV